MNEPRCTALFEMHIPFYEICYDNKVEIISLEKKLSDLEKENSPQSVTEDLSNQVSRIRYEIRKLSCISVVFAASGLENFIYKYALSSFSQRYYDQNLDRLSTLSKWRLVPKLHTGKAIPETAKSLNMINELIKARNDVIHYKGDFIQDAEKVNFEEKVPELLDKLFSREARLIRCAKQSPDIITMALRDLMSIDKSDQLAKEVEKYLDMSEE